MKKKVERLIKLTHASPEEVQEMFECYRELFNKSTELCANCPESVRFVYKNLIRWNEEQDKLEASEEPERGIVIVSNSAEEVTPIVIEPTVIENGTEGADSLLSFTGPVEEKTEEVVPAPKKKKNIKKKKNGKRKKRR